MSAHISQKQYVQIPWNFLYMLPVAMAQSSSDEWDRRHVYWLLYFIALSSEEDRATATCNIICFRFFVDDIMHSRSGAGGPESKTTHMFCRVLQVADWRRSCVYDCRLVPLAGIVVQCLMQSFYLPSESVLLCQSPNSLLPVITVLRALHFYRLLCSM